MNVSLVMVKGDGTRRDFPLGKERLVIGRINTCDLRIALPSVSRQHCEVFIEGGQLKLRDLGSSNGTFHNNTRVQEANLAAGDEIGIGPVVFRVVIDGKPAPAALAGKPAAGAKPAAAGKPAAGAKPVAGAKPAAKPAAKTGVPVPEEKEEEALAMAGDDEHSPTVDLDDPLAALAAATDDGTGNEELPLLLDEEEDAKPPAPAKGKKPS